MSAHCDWRRNLTLVRMTPDLIYDQMIGMGCATRLTFSWGGNPGAGSLYRFRDAIENDWPHPLQIDERSHADIASAYVAGAANLPFSVMRGYTGSDTGYEIGIWVGMWFYLRSHEDQGRYI